MAKKKKGSWAAEKKEQPKWYPPPEMYEPKGKRPGRKRRSYSEKPVQPDPPRGL